MKEMILSKLKEIEKQENVKIIYAVESGSRAWGFESQDSDYDVRFIYVRKPEDYLSLFPKKDTIEWELNDTYDINGWDLKKTLQLLYHSNPTLYEWKNSPIIYLSTPQWNMMNTAFQYYFQIEKVLHHYYHMSMTTYQKDKTLKRYFYTIRSILSCLWIIEKKTPPPIQLETLVQNQIHGELKSYVLSLIDIKKEQKEKDSFKESIELNQYIENQLQYIQSHLTHHKQELCPQLLDETFLNILNAIN